VPFEAITGVVMGDTDRTPDGGVSAGFLQFGGANIRKAAAYTYQALLDLAATKLGVEKSRLSVKDGVVSGGGKSISYGQLVQGQQLKLSIPVGGTLNSLLGLTVLGDPPTKPVSQYAVIGKSYANAVTPSKVTGKETWVTDVRLPDMLHARVVHPKSLGSTLISAGKVDRAKFPNAQVVVKGNLVGVLAPTEWEAIRAAQQVAGDTKWTDWKGLPGNANLYSWLREKADWKATPVSAGQKNQGTPALASAAKKVSATYELPYMKHAPIGPTIALADARADGTFYIYTHNQNPQMLRDQIARMLGTSVDNVVVRIFAGPGHYGRSNGGNAGAEDEAVILSKAVGRPVRVQWMRADDLQWSTNSPAGFSDVQIGLDASGKIIGYQADHYMPAMQDDRPVGALIAGLPTAPAPDPKGDPSSPVGSTVNSLQDPWVYDRIANVNETGHGTFQVGQKESPLAIGLRDHSMRTPGQLQQNFPREMAFSEAAALKGQGVSVMLRAGAYWACVCQISVTPSTGKVAVERYAIAVDPGIVINPMQLKRQVEGGAVMGMSHTLHEEMMFDESGVLSRDWRSYPILTMDEVPEIKVVILNKPEVGSWGGGSEAANALAGPAIAAALFDATGKIARRLPLKPAYVQTLMKA
jgi:nicotinate dehydrogenase subunit B